MDDDRNVNDPRPEHVEAARPADRADNASVPTDSETPQVLSIARSGGRRNFLRAGGALASAAAAAAASCDSPTQPPPVTTSVATSTTSIRTTTTTSTTTTSVQATFTLSGVVTDGTSRAVVPGVTVIIVDGPSANKSAVTDNNGAYSISGIISGTFTVRASRNAFDPIAIQITLTQNTRQDFVLPRTATTTTTSTGSTTTSTSICTCDLVHYWYPN